MRLPPLNALRAFEAAARHLSFRKAAAELHVTPAAVSHQVKSLEEFLGVVLFHRGPRRIQLTAAGRALQPGLSEGFAAMAAAVVQLRAQGRQGRVEVHAAPSIASKWLMPRLKSFGEKHDNIHVHLSARDSMVDPTNHEAGGEAGFSVMDGADLAIRYGHGDYPDHEVVKLLPAALVPMCSPQLLEGSRPLRTPDDLRHHVLLHLQEGAVSEDETRPSWDKWLEAAGIEGVDTSRGPHFNHPVFAQDAAADGHGVVLGVPVLAGADLAKGRLVIPFQISLPLRGAYYLVSTKETRSRPEVASVRAWLLDEAKSDPWARATELMTAADAA